jgi:hypothetical protein
MPEERRKKEKKKKNSVVEQYEQEIRAEANWTRMDSVTDSQPGSASAAVADEVDVPMAEAPAPAGETDSQPGSASACNLTRLRRNNTS